MPPWLSTGPLWTRATRAFACLWGAVRDCHLGLRNPRQAAAVFVPSVEVIYPRGLDAARDEAAAATPTRRLAVEMIPSLAPRTAARSHPMRATRWLSGCACRRLIGRPVAGEAWRYQASVRRDAS